MKKAPLGASYYPQHPAVDPGIGNSGAIALVRLFPSTRAVGFESALGGNSALIRRDGRILKEATL